jgi:acetyltransferase-like isoleucine patch superfamily enzyme
LLPASVLGSSSVLLLNSELSMDLLDRLTNGLFIWLGQSIQSVEPGVAARTLPRFATPAHGLVIRLPRDIVNPHLIRFGRDTKIGPNSVLKATTGYPGRWLQHPEGRHVAQTFTPLIVFGDRVTATSSLQVVAFERIVIEDDVMFAGNIYVSDGQHGRTRGDRPYKFQGIEGVSPVRIGRGSWIGQNVVILPGSDIGELSIIGANSVVSGTVPPRSLAVGAPARVVRTWDPNREAWIGSAETESRGRLRADAGATAHVRGRTE